jgi:carbon-monoxide dehydrogenase medium subunit
MIPADFDYRRVESVEEAVRILGSNDDARLLAGGHSLLPMMKLRLAAPSLLVDIRGVEELVGISLEGDDLVIGAMTTHDAIASSPEVRSTHAALAEAAASIGDVQVRNCGTLGGSLAHADPSADYAAAALALDATLQVQGVDGGRTLPVEELFDGLLTTSLEPSEIITAVHFPLRPTAMSAYVKFAQPASGFALVGVAVRLERDAAGVCTDARLAATGISDRPLRLSAAERPLIGSDLDDDALTAAAAMADEGIADVRSDLYASEDYRRHLLRVFAGRALKRGASREP